MFFKLLRQSTLQSIFEKYHIDIAVQLIIYYVNLRCSTVFHEVFNAALPKEIPRDFSLGI